MRDILMYSSCETVTSFLAAMERLYPLYEETTSPKQILEYIEAKGGSLDTLEALISDFKRNEAAKNVLKQCRTAEKLGTFLGLSTPTGTNAAALSRSQLAAIEDTTVYMVAVAIVCCRTCSQRFPYLVELLDKAPPGCAEVHRIPGFQYERALRNGVGLIVYENKIIGRMAAGTSMCDCEVLVDVKL
jgi:hypothetical protein